MPSDASTDNAPAVLSVVMPCYNEERTVRETCERVLASPHCCELVVVDDASTDGSLDQLALVDDPRLRILRQPVNQGKGAALRRALGGSHAVVVVLP